MAFSSIRTLACLLTLTLILISFHVPLTNADDLDNARKAGLDQHNEYRNQHDVPPLELDTALNDEAQAWADNLLRNNMFQHSGSKHGENIYMSSRTLAKDLSTSAIQATKSWYEEVCLYKQHGFGGGTGHYTQVVWAKSTKVGIGIAMSGPGGSVYVVANYDPAGNMMGSFNDKNVPPTSCDFLKDEVCKGDLPLCSKDKKPKTKSEAEGKSMRLKSDYGLIMVTIFMIMV